MTSATAPGKVSSAALAEHLYPLNEFYAQAGFSLPQIELISGAEMPEPYRQLLVHTNDMTPTLEDYYGSDIHLEVLRRRQEGECYFREVVLHLDGSEKPVEFGANKISLALFSPEVRRLILAERLPLGHILKAQQVPHTSRPQAYLRVHVDQFMRRSLGLAKAQVIYGRRNTLRDPQGRPISEIVEILPPPTRPRAGAAPHAASATRQNSTD